MRLYHGTRLPLEGPLVPSGGGEFGPGLYCTDSEEAAWMWADRPGHRVLGTAAVLVLDVQLVNPWRITKLEWLELQQRQTPRELQARAKRHGHDGIEATGLNGWSKQYVLFTSEQAQVVDTKHRSEALK